MKNIAYIVSLRLGQCHRQMISFQKIYGLYGLKHHTVEINGNVTLGHIRTYIHVNIMLEFCEMLTEFAINNPYATVSGTVAPNVMSCPRLCGFHYLQEESRFCPGLILKNIRVGILYTAKSR